MAKRRTTGTAPAQVPDFSSVPSVFVNSAAIVFTQSDFRLLLSELVPGPNGTTVTRPVINVAMSPTHFKAFSWAVQQGLERFEKQHGSVSWQNPHVGKGQK